MATSIATGALRPKVAVIIAGALNLVGAFLSVEVAKTISSGLVNDALISPVVIFAGLVGAILWNLVTWLFGMPSSSSHALFGGLIGATIVAAGTSAVNFGAVMTKIVLPAVISPTARRGGRPRRDVPGVPDHHPRRRRHDEAGVQGRADRVGVDGGAGPRHERRPEDDGHHHAHADHRGRARPELRAAVLGDPHFRARDRAGHLRGGWRIIQTLGKRVSEIQTPQGFAAETSAATVILTSSHLGFALSTTQVATGAIFGAGAGRRLASVQWGVAGQMVIAWALTLPSAAVVGAAAAWLASTGTVGTVIVVIVLVAAAAGIYAASRRRPVTAHNVNDVPAPVPATAAA